MHAYLNGLFFEVQNGIVYHKLFVSPVRGHVGCFWVWSITNKAVMYTHTLVFYGHRFSFNELI